MKLLFIFLDTSYTPVVDRISRVLFGDATNPGVLFGDFMTITKILVAFFFVLYIAYVFISAFSNNQPVNYWLLLKPFLFVSVFEVCYSGGLQYTDEIFRALGSTLNGDAVIAKLLDFNGKSIRDADGNTITIHNEQDLDNAMEKFYEKQQSLAFSADFFALRKALRQIIMNDCNDAEDKNTCYQYKSYAQQGDQDGQTMMGYLIYKQLDKAKFIKPYNPNPALNSDPNKSESTSRNNNGLWQIKFHDLKKNLIVLTGTRPDLNSHAEFGNLLDQVIDNTQIFTDIANYNLFANAEDFWAQPGMSGSWITDILNRFVMWLDQYVVAIGMEVQAILLLILKFLGFIALGLAVFYMTSDTWKKWVITYIEISLWIIPFCLALLLGKLVQYNFLLEFYDGKTVEESLIGLENVALIFTQPIIIVLTPMIVSKIIGNATLQTSFSHMGNRMGGGAGSAAGMPGKMAGGTLMGGMRGTITGGGFKQGAKEGAMQTAFGKHHTPYFNGGGGGSGSGSGGGTSRPTVG